MPAPCPQRGPGMVMTRILILGLGNDLISDDGLGPAVAKECARVLARDVSPVRTRVTEPPLPFEIEVPGRAFIRIDAAPVGGFRLIDLLAGHDVAVLIDVVQTGAVPPGTVLEWPLDRSAAGRTLGGSHQVDLCTALALGRKLGYPLPQRIHLLVAEAADLETIREELTPALARSISGAASRVLALSGLTQPSAT